jgi:DNA (cytosine-5)-methyltransferase 1
VVGENVAGFVNMELERTVADLEAEGYEVQPLIIPACAVGAPHRRDRVWIIAYSDVARWDAAHAYRSRLQEARAEQQTARAFDTGQDASKPSSNPGSQRVQGQREGQVCRFERVSWCKDGRRIENTSDRPYLSEPLVRRGSNGVPNRVDRIKCLGNAVVPQVAEIVGEMILEMEKED